MTKTLIFITSLFMVSLLNFWLYTKILESVCGSDDGVIKLPNGNVIACVVIPEELVNEDLGL